jgi:hypothetical protein
LAGRERLLHRVGYESALVKVPREQLVHPCEGMPAAYLVEDPSKILFWIFSIQDRRNDYGGKVAQTFAPRSVAQNIMFFLSITI